MQFSCFPVFQVFGLKDYQQYRIVCCMVKELDFPIEIIGCPIHRESDGLAMSSRNLKLTAGDRIRAAVINRSLCEFVEDAVRRGKSFDSLIEDAIRKIEDAGGSVDYVTVADALSLDTISSDSDS